MVLGSNPGLYPYLLDKCSPTKLYSQVLEYSLDTEWNVMEYSFTLNEYMLL